MRRTRSAAEGPLVERLRKQIERSKRLMARLRWENGRLKDRLGEYEKVLHARGVENEDMRRLLREAMHQYSTFVKLDRGPRGPEAHDPGADIPL